MRWFGWFRRRPVNTPTEKPTPRYHYTFTGHDEAMEQRARERQRQAEQIRKDARRLETRDDQRSKLRSVK